MLLVVISVGLFTAGLCGLVLTLFTDFDWSTDRDELELSFLKGIDTIYILGFIFALVTIFFITNLFVLSFAGALVLILIPVFRDQKKAGEREVKKLDAIASFSQAIADSVGGGNSLNSAINIASKSAPETIAEPLAIFRARLSSEDYTESVYRLVDDLDSPVADILGAHLIQASSMSVGNLSSTMRDISTELNNYVLMIKKVETSRRKHEFEIKGLTVILLSVISFLLLVSPDMLKVFSNGFMGELKLLSIFASTGSGWLIANKLTKNSVNWQFKLKRSFNE